MTIKAGDYYQGCKVVDIDGVLYSHWKGRLEPIVDTKDRPQSRSDKIIYDCEIEAAILAEQLYGVLYLTSRYGRLKITASDYTYYGSEYISCPFDIHKPIVVGGLMYFKTYNGYAYILNPDYQVTLIPGTPGNKKIIDRIHELKSIRDYEYKLQSK